MAIANVKKRTVPQRHDTLESLHHYGIHIDSREIYIGSAGHVNDEESGVDFAMANNFLRNLRYLEAFEDTPILIHFCCTGGDWEYGMAIYDAIANSPCHVISISHGWAVSMSSIMMQAADTRLLMPNCDFMVHQGNSGFSGTSKQFLTTAEWIAHTNEKMLDIYVKRCKDGAFFRAKQMNDKAVKTFLVEKMDKKEDWWLTAKDAVYHGFADGLVGDENYETIAKIMESGV